MRMQDMKESVSAFLGTFDVAAVLHDTKLVTAGVPECGGLPTAGLLWSWSPALLFCSWKKPTAK